MIGQSNCETRDSRDEPTVRVAVPGHKSTTERRQLLTAFDGAGVTVLTGCLDTGDEPTEEDSDSYEVAFVKYHGHGGPRRPGLGPHHTGTEL